ncbi:MAG: hypothetical protein LLF83_08330 [Methanobacterium sp.]|nr:hypothetical protein [Methanobacterium sp.]
MLPIVQSSLIEVSDKTVAVNPDGLPSGFAAPPPNPNPPTLVNTLIYEI